MSDPTLHCNACGREIPVKRSMGREFRCCSIECVREMNWRHTLSIMGEPYRESPETVAWAKHVLGEDGASEENRASEERTSDLADKK
jgi:hypothetical protein